MAATAMTVALTVAPSVQAQTAGARTSTEWTLDTGHPRTPEQLAMRFDVADLSIKVMPQTRTIEGVATLTFTAEAPLDRLVVELDTVFDVASVSVDGVDVAAGTWTNPEGRMTIPLAQPLAAGETARLRIAYSGAPRVAVNAPWDGGFVWSRAPGGKPWIATAVQGDGCDLFWPCIDHPMSEPGRVDLHITVPSDLSAPSNGRFLGKQDHGDGWTTWNWTARDPNNYAIALTVGPYVELTGTYESRFGNTIPLHFWHLDSADPTRAAGLFAEFGQQLEFYERVIGPFPFADEKMGVVETPHLGMEHQTINAYGNGYKKDDTGYDWLLHHELAHEWFGNQMTNVTWDDMWLHEGFGTYMQPLYTRYLNGERNYQATMNEQRTALVNRYPIVSGRPLTEEQVYEGEVGPGNDIYYKGSQILHTLRLLIGDAAFYEATRRLVYGRPDPQPGNFEPRFATTQDFVTIVEQVTGREMSWFFDAYLYQATLPDLKTTRQGDLLSLEWVTGDGGPFPMPIEVEVDGQVTSLAMTGNRGSLSVPADAHVLIDPMNKVLRRLDAVDAYNAWVEEQRARVRR
jgi:aminopeptidase N